MKCSIVFLVMVGALCKQQGAPDGQSVIRGHVFDQSRKPVFGASVSLFPLQAGTSGALPRALTDRDGYYELRAPALGKTRVVAAKIGEGFPDSSGSLFVSGDEQNTEVRLTEGQTYEQVDVHLPAADGTIFGSVVDDVTGRQVAEITVSLRRKDDPSRYYRSSQQGSLFMFDLPPRAVEMDVSAPGYLRWHTELTLRAEEASTHTPREVRRITVRLQRSDVKSQ